MATRRRPGPSGPPAYNESTSADTPSTPSATGILPAPSPHPLLPTALETVLISLYPLTLFLGSLTSTLSPRIRASKSIYSPTHQSYQPPHHAPSYFARKRNFLNVYFVKIGWFWTTLALLVFIFTHTHFGKPLTLHKWGRRRIAAVFRWFAVTVFWALTTQWCFGPPLIDRSFTLSGGACQTRAEQKAGLREEDGPVERILTHAQCKVAGGTWSGGIDISGHVFLLILGSAMLWLEVLPTVLKARGLRESRRIVLSDGRVVNARKESQGEKQVREEEAEAEVTKLGVKLVVTVVGLSWWMLLMTAAFFHTWSEKLSGLVVAFFAIWTVYFLPRGVPAMRAVFGIPGV